MAINRFSQVDWNEPSFLFRCIECEVTSSNSHTVVSIIRKFVSFKKMRELWCSMQLRAIKAVSMCLSCCFCTILSRSQPITFNWSLLPLDSLLLTLLHLTVYRVKCYGYWHWMSFQLLYCINLGRVKRKCNLNHFNKYFRSLVFHTFIFKHIIGIEHLISKTCD